MAKKDESFEVGRHPDATNGWIADGEALNLPRMAIGPDDVEKGVVSLFQGTYLKTEEEEQIDPKTGESKMRLLHTCKLAKPNALGDTITLWGSAIIDRELPTLPEGTKFQLEYLGEGKSKRGKLKKVLVTVPRGTVRHENPFFVEEHADE